MKDNDKWQNQYNWRKFLDNIFLFVMLFAMVSFLITYIASLAIFKVTVEVAMIFTMVHIFVASGLFVTDIIRQIYSTVNKTFVRGEWFDSPTDVAFGDGEIVEYQQIETNKLTDETKLKDYIPYKVTFKFEDKPVRVILVHKTQTFHTFETIFKAHMEAVVGRYPIPAHVTYASFMLTPIKYIEDANVPVYELKYSEGMTFEEQQKWCRKNA